MKTTPTDCVQKQRAYFHTGATLPIEFRLRALKKLKKAVMEYEERGREALAKDLEKSSFETYFGEWGSVLVEIDFHIKHLKRWAKEKRVKTPLFLQPSHSRIMYEPYGVSLILSPWNYPFQLVMMPLIAGISAGNTMVIKPSELAPHTAKMVKELIESTFEEEYIAVVEGGVSETDSLLRERFDFIFFTGSTEVGKIIAKEAANHLTPIVLELGGKSPVILDDSVSLQVAVKRIAMAKIANCGQTCVAPDYLLVPETRKEEVVQAFETVMKDFFPQGELDCGKTYQSMARIVNDRHFHRLKGLLEGERILWGGATFEEEGKFQPTLIDSGKVKDYLNGTGIKRGVLKEEIFGPFLPLLTYGDMDEVIEYIRCGEKPLALYLFSNDKALQRKVLKRISFGGGCVNDSMVHLANEYLPFGGVGHSGQGAYHGKAGFLAFSHEKSLLYSKMVLDLPIKYPPHTPQKLKWLKRIFK